MFSTFIHVTPPRLVSGLARALRYDMPVDVKVHGAPLALSHNPCTPIIEWETLIDVPRPGREA